MTNDELNKIFRFRKFQVYQDGRKFVAELKKFTKNRLPKEETFALRSQLWRALDSFLLNIAEGADRGSDKDFAKFLNQSHTSLNEVVACLDIGLDNVYITIDEHHDWMSRAAELANQVTAFRKKLLQDDKSVVRKSTVNGQRSEVQDQRSTVNGQSILEVIVALGIFSLIAAAMVSMTTGSFLSLQQGGQQTTAEALAQEGIEAMRSIRDGAFNEIYVSPATVSISGNQWVVVSGASETIGDYTRTLTVAAMCRDGNDDLATCPATYTDAHTWQVTSSVSWVTIPGKTDTVQRVAYITNWDSADWTQTDWDGGTGQTTWSDATKYDTGSNVSHATDGQIALVSGDTEDDAFNNAVDGTLDWPFATAGNYTYDSGLIEVTGGLAQLKDTGSSIDANTMGLWHLNESSGDLIDSSTNGNDLTQTRGAPAYAQSGKFSTSLAFDGDDSKYINNGSQTGLDITGIITIDAWIYKTAAATSDEIIVGKWKESGNHRSYALVVGETNRPEFWISSDGKSSGVTEAVGTTSVALNEWVHISGVYDGSNMYIFYNGTLEKTVSFSSGIADKSAFFGIASAEGMGGSNGFFVGRVDEARVSNTARWTATYTVPTGAYGPGYATSDPTIVPTTSGSASGLSAWATFVETATKNGGEAYYQLSSDGGTTWQYWNGSAWATAGAANYNTASVVNTNIGSFSIATSQINFKAFLSSDGSQQVKLDHVTITFTASGSSWSFATWDVGNGEETPLGSHNQSGGNGGGYVDVTMPIANNDTIGGYWEQAFTTYIDNPTGDSIAFDYKVVDYNSTPTVAHIRVYVDTASGTPTTQVGSSVSVSAEGAWTSASSIDPSAAITTAGTYYLKMAFWLETSGGNPGPYTIGFDNVNINLGNGTYPTSGTVQSSAFNMSNASPVQEIEWDETVPSSCSCTLRLQIQTAPDSGGSPGTWSSFWQGPDGEDSDATDFYTANTGERVHTDMNGDQWVRYLATFTGDGTGTPILTESRINYK